MPKKSKAEIRKSISKPLSKDPAIRAKQVKRRKSLAAQAEGKRRKKKGFDVFDVAGLGVERRLRGGK